MRKMKRCLAVFLVLCLLASLFTVNVFAETPAGEAAVRWLSAEEVEGFSRLDTTGDGTTGRPALYADDELVTVIVQLEDAPVMEYYGMSTYAAEAEAGDATPGEAVSEFLNSADAVELSEELLAQQEDVVDRMDGDTEPEVVGQWTSVINAVAVKVPYGQLSAIQAMEGVKRAYVERTFERPEEPVTEAGEIASYSYDMIGIQEVWDAGYTGKGMLVAVVDTGLDLNWQAYADPHIVSVHEAFTDTSFKSADATECLRYNATSLAAFLKANTLNAEFRGGSTELTYDYNALYKNLKVPFAYDYADLDLNVLPSDSDHGTHVSGTIVGYSQTEEGVVEFSGVAPDAQLLSLKVFSDEGGGAKESDTMDALEDAMKLGADVINLSLGSDNGFAEDDTAQEELYDTIRAAGILLMTSAGNSNNSADSNNYYGYNLASNPEISMMSSPAVYDSNLAVASINNTVQVETVFTWTDKDGQEHEVVYIDPTGVAMKYKFVGEEPVSIVPVDGVGTYNDYYNAGFRSYYGYGGAKGVSGIALVQRGEISFVDKINNASSFMWSYYDSELGYYVNECPVKAVLVYDNVDGDLIYMSTDGTSLTSAFISKADGEEIVAAIEAGCDVKISVQEKDRLSIWDQGYEMSEFTSWGAGPSLELKPEITAPGGNIWSAIVGGSYGMMSGTSMAAPHMTGVTALVEQYVHSKNLVSKQADADLTEQLMVSTAVPQVDEYGEYYSPRRQGAGLVNAAAAIQTPAYISVEGQRVGKLELKDDPERTGTYTLTFTVNNMTTETLNYHMDIVVMCPDYLQLTEDCTLMWDSDFAFDVIDGGTVTVPGMTTGSFSSTTVSKTITLDDGTKAALDEIFENGTYIEGYVILTDENEVNPQIGLPYLAFYGDWTAAPIFDSATWIDEVPEGGTFMDNECTWNPTILGYFDGYSYYNLGQNPFDSMAGDEQGVYYQENITISPNGLFKSVNDYIIYQLRESKLMVVEVRDKETGELYYRDLATYQFKTTFDSNYNIPVPSSLYYFTETDWDGTDLEGNVLPNGTQCVYTITAYGDGDYGEDVYYEDYEMWGTNFDAVDPTDPSTEPTFNGHAMDKTGDVISFDILVDTEAPKLVNNAVSMKEEDGAVTLSGTFQDGVGSIASVTVYPQVKRSYKTGYGDPSYAEYGLDMDNPFYVEYVYDADVHEWTFQCDITEYAHTNESWAGENYYYDYEWTGNVFIYGGDYGGNDRVYAVTVDTDPGLVLSTTSALLYVGDEFDLSVIDNTESGLPITRTSTNPEVATVDEYGHIVAVAPGQTTIEVSNGEETVVCIVAVRERPTEVLDFDLTLESFDGLKPAGETVVKVTNLQPANVELTEIRWDVSEDEETAENYEGLINCEKYSSDGLSGLIYLNYSAYDPYNMGNPAIPGGSGTLTVTLNGVSRTMELNWEDLYKTNTDEDLISDLYGSGQTVYVTQGETATLIAKYNDASAHGGLPVELYSKEGASNYSYNNPTEESVGLILDGPTTVAAGASWSGKLVNLEGYALPETIEVGYSYPSSDGSVYEYWWQNSEYYSYYTYDSTTGEIVVYNAPYGATNTLVIRADGVVSEGNPAGKTSGVVYETPDALYGPFDWAATEDHEITGELTTAEGIVVDGYTEKNVAYYTPSEPGVSYITATSKDGKYSVNFAVICEPLKAETVSLNTNNLELAVGETEKLTATLSPEPSLEKDGKLNWVSYNPEVATVDENGVVTAVSEGYAYIHVSVCVSPEAGRLVETYCLVHVVPAMSYHTVTFVDWDDTVLKTQSVLDGTAATAPADPTREGYTFAGWDVDFSSVTADLTVKATYTVNTYTITFVADGKTVSTVTKAYGETLTDADYPPVPAKDGFVGEWSKVTDPVTGNLTITAVYKTAGNNGGSGHDTGDHFDMTLWGALMATAAAGMTVLVVLKRRKREN